MPADIAHSVATQLPSFIDADMRARLAGVRLFLCDVDGILTDTAIWMGGPDEFKRFHIQDGLGLRLLQRHQIQVGWISARPSHATALRAADLKVDFVHQGDGSKVKAAEGILEQTGLAWADVCYMGDDVVDLGVLRRARLAATVSNALPEAKAVSHYITALPGGGGAVREVVELILKAQGHWEGVIRHFLE